MSTNTLPPPATFTVDLSDCEPGAIMYTVQQGSTTLHIRLTPEQANHLAAQLAIASVAANASIMAVELAKQGK
jgi:hypothetical protein